MKFVLLALSAVLGLGCVPLFAHAARAAEPSVFVDCEYGDLKEVVVGLPYGMSPSLDAPWFEDAMTFAFLDEPEDAQQRVRTFLAKRVRPASG